jgi:ribonucleoside-diphosphate reductase alpha chain
VKPDCFVTAGQLPARAHLSMQAAVQPLVDSAISKTINLPATATAAEVADIFTEAYRLGLKGCTVYREGSLQGQVLQAASERACCQID